MYDAKESNGGRNFIGGVPGVIWSLVGIVILGIFGFLVHGWFKSAQKPIPTLVEQLETDIATINSDNQKNHVPWQVQDADVEVSFSVSKSGTTTTSNNDSDSLSFTGQSETGNKLTLHIHNVTPPPVTTPTVAPSKLPPARK